MTEAAFTVSSSIPVGKSWADQADSPGWAARSPPKFSEEIPDIVLDEEEYDRLPASASMSAPISVFIGGLDYALEAKDIEEFFSSKGVRVTRVRIQKQNGRSLGKAFLNVADKNTLDSILKLTGSTIGGRQISIKEDVAPRPARTSSSKSDNRQSKLGGRWREEERPKAKNDSNWQAVGKGGKFVEPTRDDRRKRQPEKRDVKPEPLKRKERREAKPVPQVIVPEPVKPVKKKTVNRFAVDSSSESDDE
jgi:RNA recognition motif-containing protein